MKMPRRNKGRVRSQTVEEDWGRGGKGRFARRERRGAPEGEGVDSNVDVEAGRRGVFLLRVKMFGRRATLGRDCRIEVVEMEEDVWNVRRRRGEVNEDGLADVRCANSSRFLREVGLDMLFGTDCKCLKLEM